MKGMFPEFDRKSDHEFNRLWKNAVFVFDTNVLLNLYRYPASTRETFFGILKKLPNRVWAPHHVALEFQRNRLTVVSEQMNTFSLVEGIVKNGRKEMIDKISRLQLEKRHSLIKTEEFESSLNHLTDQFLEELTVMRNEQYDVGDHDDLKGEIESVFEGAVGLAPKNQDELDNLYKEAEGRYVNEIPPGYMDLNKSKDEGGEYYHNGLTYKKVFGDYLIWRQTLEYCKDNEVKELVFITDDQKEDWWWVLNSNGKKTVGPRPELQNEASIFGGVDLFHMYKSESFLIHAKKYLGFDVGDAEIDEVRDISGLSTFEVKTAEIGLGYRGNVVELLMRWLGGLYPSAEIWEEVFPDIIVESRGSVSGFEVLSILGEENAKKLAIYKISRLSEMISNGKLDSGFLVCVSDRSGPEFNRIIPNLRSKSKAWGDVVEIINGAIVKSESGDFSFVPSELY
ncbi:PIN-like domain-containing protein [Heliomarina baculiformis]|uniref:PIN-like domain-containing protein n=1 Tax=Heliomarina baculiformis TaxID=2872036 RepID=UPI001EE36FC8|nr:PIN domain-containing protein [Heliomarina baculiformis]